MDRHDPVQHHATARPAAPVTAQAAAPVMARAAAVGPAPAAVSAADNPLPMGDADTASQAGSSGSPAAASAAAGRRILSTAFVRVGADGLLTVSLRDGQTVVLRDVSIRADDYCGTRVGGGAFCGEFAAVIAARPGNGARD